jgi:hypothetical protein
MSGCLIVFAAVQEQLEVAQGRVAKLGDANMVLTEQVAKAERDRDAVAANHSATTVRAGQLRDRHAALLWACDGGVDMLSPAGVSTDESPMFGVGN